MSIGNLKTLGVLPEFQDSRRSLKVSGFEFFIKSSRTLDSHKELNPLELFFSGNSGLREFIRGFRFFTLNIKVLLRSFRDISVHQEFQDYASAVPLEFQDYRT